MWTLKGSLPEVRLHDAVKPKRAHVLTQVAISAGVPRAIVEYDAVRVELALRLLASPRAVAQADALALLDREAERHDDIWLKHDWRHRNVEANSVLQASDLLEEWCRHDSLCLGECAFHRRH